jgi:hypothetical protein
MSRRKHKTLTEWQVFKNTTIIQKIHLVGWILAWPSRVLCEKRHLWQKHVCDLDSAPFLLWAHFLICRTGHCARVVHWWLEPVILATWEAEIGRIKIWGQPRQIVHETPSPKITRAKWTGGISQVVEHCFESTKHWTQTPLPPKKWGGVTLASVGNSWKARQDKQSSAKGSQLCPGRLSNTATFWRSCHTQLVFSVQDVIFL